MLGILAEAFGDPGDIDAFGSASASTSVFSSDALVASADFPAFTGPGSLDDVFAGIFFPIDSASFADNASTMSISGDSSLTDISYSLLYTYTPVPEPGAALLGAFAVAIPLLRRRR